MVIRLKDTNSRFRSTLRDDISGTGFLVTFTIRVWYRSGGVVLGIFINCFMFEFI